MHAYGCIGLVVIDGLQLAACNGLWQVACCKSLDVLNDEQRPHCHDQPRDQGLHQCSPPDTGQSLLGKPAADKKECRGEAGSGEPLDTPLIFRERGDERAGGTGEQEEKNEGGDDGKDASGEVLGRSWGCW